MREGRRRLFENIALLLPPGVFLPQTLQCFIHRFVIDLLFLALCPVVLPEPGVSRVCIHSEIARRLCNRLVRFDRQFDRALLEGGRIFFHGELTHRTHLV